MQQFRKLKIWNESINFVTKIYQLTNKFPQYELFGLVAQLRRAAVSITLNIAEGCGNYSNLEFKRFLSMALRSIYEVISGLEIAKKLKYNNTNEINNLIIKADKIAGMICSLMKKLKTDN